MSLAEAVVAMGLAVGVASASLALVTVARVVSATQPEVADLQQRLRVGIDTIAGEVAAAGSGFDQTSLAGPLVHIVPPIAPYRRGQVLDDALAGVWFRPNVISVFSVASSQAQASVTTAVVAGGRLHATLAPNCGLVVPALVCGFTPGMRVMLAHPSGAHDLLTVETVAGPVVVLSYVGALGSTYADGRAALAQVDTSTFSPGRDTSTGAPNIARYDGFLTSHPAVDHVVGLSFEYFGLAEPPVVRDPTWLPRWQSVTYGPAPPQVTVDDPSTSWGTGENCTFGVVAGVHVPRLVVLGPPGTLVPLSAALLSDGPWCPDDTSPRRFDADLLRVRRVRIRVRAEAGSASLRGWGPLVARPGTAAPGVTTTPDQEAVVDVAPRGTLPWH